MQLNDIIIVSDMVSDAYTITDIDPILLNMADTDISIWHRCIPNRHMECIPYYTSAPQGQMAIGYVVGRSSVH